MRKIFFYTTFYACLYLNSIAQKPIKVAGGVDINGIQQWIGVTSKSDTNPLLLFLHGGPGFSSRSYSKRFVKQLKKDFIIAEWDQRNTGLTASWNEDSRDISLPLMESDTELVIDYLLEKFGKEKLYLVGFSWGNFLGLNYANQHPEKVHAYISVSGIFNGTKADSLSLATIKKQADATQNEAAILELNATNVPIQSWQDLYHLRKWTAFFSGAISSTKAYPASLFQNWSKQWLPVFKVASGRDYINEVKALECPVYFFAARKDLLANYRIAEEYYNTIGAPSKGLIWFEESTHEVPGEEPVKFSQELIHIKMSIQNEGQ